MPPSSGGTMKTPDYAHLKLKTDVEFKQKRTQDTNKVTCEDFARPAS